MQSYLKLYCTHGIEMIVTRKLLYKSVHHLNMYKKKLPRFILQKVELTWLSHSEQEFHLTTHEIVSLLAVTLAERTERECCFSLVLVLIVCLVFFSYSTKDQRPKGSTAQSELCLFNQSPIKKMFHMPIGKRNLLS